MSKTLFDSIVEEDAEGRPRYIYNISQFNWFRDSMRRTVENEMGRAKDADLIKCRSAVRFQLPFHPAAEAPSMLLVVGNGLDLLDVYLATVNTGEDILTGEIPENPSKLYRLFSYVRDAKFTKKGHKYGFEEEIERTIPLHEIFTTDIKPFLGVYGQPEECLRDYRIKLSWVDEELYVIADNKKDRSKQNLKILYKPDPRDGEPEHIITLHRDIGNGWTSDSLENEISTWKFTFSSTVNSG